MTGKLACLLGAAALPEPEPAWLVAAEELPLESIWQGGHVLPPSPTGEAVTRLAQEDVQGRITQAVRAAREG